MLSKKTRYAMVALAYLAREYGKGPILIGVLARKEKIPQRFLESILLELKKEGILGSKLGKAGGYYLLKHPDDVSLLDVVRRFEGSVSLLYCVSENSYQPCEFCRIEDSCKIRKVFKDIRDNTYQILKGATLSSLIKETDQ